MTAYFATLLMASLGGLFLLWYFGAPVLGIVGANKLRLQSAIQTLEVKADLQGSMIASELKERMGDVLMLAESQDIKQALATPSRLHVLLAQKYHTLQQAHPHRFSQLFVVQSPAGRIVASTVATEAGTIFSDIDWLSRLAASNESNAIARWEKTDGQSLVVFAQRLTPANWTSNSRQAQPQLFLMAVLDLALFFEDGFEPERNVLTHIGASYLFDRHAHLMAQFPPAAETDLAYKPDQAVLDQFEGTRQVHLGDGERLILVYRKLRLGSEEVWSMVHVAKQSEVLSGLLDKINMLLAAGVFITLLALGLIYFAARKLTRPLGILADSATRLGQGDFTARAEVSGDEDKEVQVLARAFNEMAHAVQHGQAILEQQIEARTQELARSEARHLNLFNATANATLLLDQGQIIDCNPAAVAIFGAHDLHDLLYRHLSELSPMLPVNGNDPAIRVEDYIRRAEKEGYVGFEWKQRRLDSGTSYDAELLLNRVELDGKQLLQASVRDISARKKIEAALHASEARHRTLVEWSPEGINVHRKGKLVYVNASAIRMLGAHSADQLIGLEIEKIIHPNFHHLINNRVKSIDDAGVHDDRYEIQYVKIDGSVIDVTAQAALIDFDGLPSIYVAWHDVTEFKRIGEAQRIAATAFESQEGMFVTDANWQILRTNQSFSQMTGYSMEELVGRPPHFLTDEFKLDMAYTAMLEGLAERGSWQGEVTDKRKIGKTFPAWLNISSVKDEQGRTTHFVGTFNDITLRKSAEDEIRSLAFYDPLTQLPNRRLLMDRLEQALASGNRHKRKGALLFIDLDNFKTLNDTLGHDQGDRLLQQVAERLNLCTREGDTVARLGGDEFVVMLEDLSEDAMEAASQAETVAIKILSELNQTYWLGVSEHHSSPSIGVTLFGEKQETIAEPLKRADLAMYQAKSAGRNTIRFFDPKMQAMVSRRAELEEDLRDAMLKDQFELHYQAQFDEDGKLFGAEVLIRWLHPKRGMISPAEFIPLAEETGLICILGYWVLHTATNQLARWASDPWLSQISIAVNVSPSQFHQKNFVEQVLDVLELTGANPHRLKLELTEGFSISNIEDVIVKMSKLKQIGVGFSLDDFGTGYSSLSYLKRLPLDQLKIDQSFVRDILIDPNDAAISRMVIVLAESLGLMVIAEGVETQEQKAFLAEQGCRAYQGYLYSKPLPLAQFEAFALRAFEEC
ncbi:MAG: EAL domain-containing protein [Burkholderiales bacterium]|nr:EAL domain-containing protein [Burkholderiales bacterium]